MAKLSLQEQMLKAGLVDKKKLKKAAKSNKKSRTLKKEVKEAAEQTRQEQQDKAKELNKQQQEEANKKAILAQIKQLIEMNILPRGKADIGYNFTHDTAVKKIYVSEDLQRQLVNGRLAIVEFGDGYEVVPSIVAEKIAQRDESLVVVANEVTQDIEDEDDPYADFKIPDDLMW